MSVDTLEAPATDPELSTTEPVLNRDGSVRRKPGPKPGGARRAPKQAKAPGFRATPAPKKAPVNDFRPALLGLMQIPQALLALGAKAVKKDETKQALALDQITIGLHAPNIAEAINTTAQHDAKLAAACEKIATVGPYSLIISAILTPAFQIAANHGAIPPNDAMGILSPETLISQAMAA